MIRPIVRPLVSNVVRAVNGVTKVIRYAYNFDGIDDYGVLDNRAIDVEGDNTFEFWSPPNVSLGRDQVIVSQNRVTSGAQIEFRLFINTSGFLVITFGGSITTLFSIIQGFEPEKRYGLSLIGNNFTVYEGGLDGTAVRTGTFTRGAAREPLAKTVISARTAIESGIYTNFFQGPQYDIVINGRLWPMASKGQAVQPSIPAGNNMTLVNMNPDRWSKIPV